MATQPPEPAATDRPVAVITGASSGIGLATALELAQRDYDIVLAARDKKELDKAANQVRDQNPAALAVTVPTDTTDEKAMQALADSTLQRFHRIDVWINDAGVYLTGKFEDIPLEDMRRMFDTNFFGYVYGSRAALAEFRQAGRGTLINISSVNASAPQPYVAVYSASKAAVRALDESLRMELRLDGLNRDIHVCTVMPASIDTNLFQNAGNYTGQELQALEPVYDPAYVARQIVKLTTHPKRQIIVGPAGRLMALQNAHLPGSYERRMSRYTQADLLSQRPATLTDGNLFDTVGSQHSLRGDWWGQRRHAHQSPTATAALATGAVAAAVGLALLGYRSHHPAQRRHHHHRRHHHLRHAHSL